jgi:putative acetyltransferase
LYLSLVAVTGTNQIIGHVGFSPTTIDGLDYGWLQMAPVSVLPDYQLKGVGSALIQAGISALITRGVAGVAVVGNPVYYERFGFRNIPGLEPLIPSDAPYFRAQSLFGPEPQGRLRYAPAFD